MAKQEFLENFRIARNLFVHTFPTPADAEPGTQEARTAVWFTPRSVRGFDVNDFPELGADKQAELKVAVQEFLAVANQVPPTKLATAEQVRTTATIFQRMLTILRNHQATPREGEIVEQALRQVEFPPWAVNWDYELGNDHDDDPAVWVTIFVDPESTPRKQVAPFASEINEKIRLALSALGSNRWPYIRMRTAVEHKMM